MSKYKKRYNALTMKYLKERGFRVGSVDRYFAGISHDLFGIIDMVALTGNAIIGIQSTSYGQRADHLETLLKLRRSETEDWLRSGGELWLMSWKKKRAELSEASLKRLKKEGNRRRKSLSFRYELVLDHITLSVVHSVPTSEAAQ